MNYRLSRRQLLRVGVGALAGLSGAALGRASYQTHQIQQLDDPARDFSRVSQTLSLKQRAAAKNILYGGATDYRLLAANPQFAERWVAECGILVPENDLKWRALRPQPDQFDFTTADRLLAFTQQHQLQMRGHTLLWHLALPDWFAETVTRQNAEQILVNHIQTVAKRYAGQMHSWDVVNEAIEIGDGRPDGMRRQPWLELLGDDYIELAFQVAAEADPEALLVYNDFGLEYDSPENAAKRRAVLQLLERLTSKNLPIHAFGLQAHLVGDEQRFKPEILRQFLAEIAAMGLQIFVTELDVIDQKLPRHIPTRDRIVAGVYADFLAATLEEPAVTTLLTWGLSDRHTWISEFFPRADGAAVRPLPLDQNLERKLAWNALAQAFDQAKVRSPVAGAKIAL